MNSRCLLSLIALLIVPACQSDRPSGPAALEHSPDAPAEDSNVPSRSPGFALFSMRNIDASGDVEVCGRIHANIAVVAGGNSFDMPDSCPGGTSITDSAYILPPWIKTQPRYYPDATYYYVVGKPTGTDSVWVCRPDPNGALRIRSANGVRVAHLLSIRTGVGAGFVARYTATQIQYNFDSAAKLQTYFDQTTGVFRRNAGAGDQTVVVNFGEYLDGAPARTSNIELDDSPGFPSPLQTTIINTRYIGADDSPTNLVETSNWIGGYLTLEVIAFRPANGITFIAHALNGPGSGNISAGAPTKPGVIYVTGNVDPFNLNGEVFGTFVILGDMSMNGTPIIWYDDGYETVLPEYLKGFWGPLSIPEDGV